MIWIGTTFGLVCMAIIVDGIRSAITRKQPIQLPQRRTTDRLHRLQQIRVKAAWHREQLHALAAECCEVMKVDPTNDTNDRDICDEVVYCGRDPITVIQKLEQEA